MLRELSLMEAKFLTLEKFIEMLGNRAVTMSEKEIYALYEVSLKFANFAYKKWFSARNLKCKK